MSIWVRWWTLSPITTPRAVPAGSDLLPLSFELRPELGIFLEPSSESPVVVGLDHPWKIGVASGSLVDQLVEKFTVGHFTLLSLCPTSVLAERSSGHTETTQLLGFAE